jgi:hypothetical protein
MPEALSNRTADNWLPVLAVADAIGGDWPKKARAAALALERGEIHDDDVAIRLLADIQRVTKGMEVIHSADLVELLNGIDSAPWPEIANGKPLTTARLATMLRDFGIEPDQIKVKGDNLRGYRLNQFEPVFAAYFPDQPAHPPASGCYRCYHIGIYRENADSGCYLRGCR